MEEKTTLQKIKEQLEKKMTLAIVCAIEDGAKIEHSKYVTNGYTIDGVFVQILSIDNISVCLNMKSEIICKACKPSKDELEKLAAEKRAELEEIENQLKSEQI